MPSSAFAAEPIQRTQLHDAVLKTLRGMILRGELAPGSRVQERLLCDQLHISRTPLREALKVLAASGLIDLLPNRGARIAPLRADEVAEAFEVLSLLERWAGEQAAANLDDQAVQELARMHSTMVAYGRAHDGESLLRIDLQIHRIIVEAAGNRTLANVHDSLALKVERARYLASMSPERVRYSMQEHEVILNAIIARDGPRIAEALYTHCLKTRDATVLQVRTHFPEEAASEAA